MVKVRDHCLVVSKALVVAYACTSPCAEVSTWMSARSSLLVLVEFLLSLKARLLTCAPAISDQHEILKAAIARVLLSVAALHRALHPHMSSCRRTSASRRRCAQRGVQRRVPEPAKRLTCSSCSNLRAKCASCSSAEDLIAFYTFPHTTKIRSTNPLERSTRIARTTSSSSPTPSVVRLAARCSQSRTQCWSSAATCLLSRCADARRARPGRAPEAKGRPSQRCLSHQPISLDPTPRMGVGVGETA